MALIRSINTTVVSQSSTTGRQIPVEDAVELMTALYPRRLNGSAMPEIPDLSGMVAFCGKEVNDAGRPIRVMLSVGYPPRFKGEGFRRIAWLDWSVARQDPAAEVAALAAEIEECLGFELGVLRPSRNADSAPAEARERRPRQSR